FNGEQLHGRQDVDMGDERWGIRVTYSQLTGSDYESGDDSRIPSGYNSRDVTAVMGYSPGPDSRIEFGYMRLDQTGLKFPGQVFDTDFLVTNAYRLHYTLENQDWFDRLSINGWYNRTSMTGNAQDPAKRARTPILDQVMFVGFTDIDLASSG